MSKVQMDIYQAGSLFDYAKNLWVIKLTVLSSLTK
jgi:hypothetical protein